MHACTHTNVPTQMCTVSVYIHVHTNIHVQINTQIVVKFHKNNQRIVAG